MVALSPCSLHWSALLLLLFLLLKSLLLLSLTVVHSSFAYVYALCYKRNWLSRVLCYAITEVISSFSLFNLYHTFFYYHCDFISGVNLKKCFIKGLWYILSVDIFS